MTRPAMPPAKPATGMETKGGNPSLALSIPVE